MPVAAFAPKPQDLSLFMSLDDLSLMTFGIYLITGEKFPLPHCEPPHINHPLPQIDVEERQHCNLLQFTSVSAVSYFSTACGNLTHLFRSTLKDFNTSGSNAVSFIVILFG